MADYSVIDGWYLFHAITEHRAPCWHYVYGRKALCGWVNLKECEPQPDDVMTPGHANCVTCERLILAARKRNPVQHVEVVEREDY